MATSKLSLYNGALRACGERKLASLSENREPRRLLDDIWDGGASTGSAIDYCLEQGQWVFATRAVQLDYSPSVEPPFGYRYAFDRPADFIRSVSVCSDPYFQCPLLQYTPEAGFFFCDLQTFYLKYVSNDTGYGADLSLWPQSFCKFVESYLAREIAPRLKNGSDQAVLEQGYKMAKVEALSKDALEEPTTFPPQGSWVSARTGGRLNRERGSRY